MKVIPVINTKIRIKIATFHSTAWRAMYVWNQNFSNCIQPGALFFLDMYSKFQKAHAINSKDTPYIT